MKYGGFYQEQELVMRACIRLTPDKHKNFLIYLDEANRQQALMESMYQREGFSDRFEWEMDYFHLVVMELFLYSWLKMGVCVEPAEDEYTNPGKPPDYVVKSIKRETRKWLKDLRKTIDYIFRSIQERDKSKIENGIISLYSISLISASIIDKKHGRQFRWRDGERPDWMR